MDNDGKPKKKSIDDRKVIYIDPSKITVEAFVDDQGRKRTRRVMKGKDIIP